MQTFKLDKILKNYCNLKGAKNAHLTYQTCTNGTKRKPKVDLKCPFLVSGHSCEPVC